ncbi:MAG: hypothetical protein AAFQ87_07125, partial [Bacteroidota bacterium]
MKRTILSLSILMLVSASWAQRPTLERIKRNTKQQASQRAEQRANQAVDKGLDKLEDAIFGKKSESTPATPTPTSGTDSSASPSSTPVLFPQSDDSSGFSPFGMGNAEVEPFESRAFGNENSPAGVIGKGPYGLESAFVVQKTTTEGMQAVSSLMYDTLRFVDYG